MAFEDCLEHLRLVLRSVIVKIEAERGTAESRLI
jgi:hypothetical protein